MALTRFSESIPGLLSSLGVSLVVSSNTAGRVFILFSDGNQLVQNSIRIKKPMGLALNGDYLAIAHHQGVSLYRDHVSATQLLPGNQFKKLYYPMANFVCYGLNHHDLAFTSDGLVTVNTTYSCLAKVDTYGEYSFKTLWRPHFVSKIAAVDCCHLNGMAVNDSGDILYATAFSTTDVGQSWRDGVMGAGVVINVQDNQVILDGFTMPHSPRWYHGKLYFFSSATEELFQYSPDTHSVETIMKFDGFVRGLDFYQRYAFIGISRLRKSRAFGFLPIVDKVIRPGVVVVDIIERKIVGEIVFPDGVDEIFDVKVLPETPSATVYDPKAPGAMQAVISDSVVSWIQED